ncbi:MAG TPA: hypothetical protein VKR59_11460 [Terriglobales bacterium]|nr:hypothetical protein [Terriglobales bacterium]
MTVATPSRFRSNYRSTVLAVACLVFCGAGFAQIDTSDRTSDRTPIPSGPYRIAGIVVNAKTSSVLVRTRVTIADVKRRQSMQSVITGDDGRFEFHVPAGKYSLNGAKRGYIAAAYNEHEQYSTAIVTNGDIDSENLTLRLAPNAVLAGGVFDEFQDPVRHAEVIVYRENHVQGVSRIEQYRATVTDDQGRYEVAPLDEGIYFVSAKASPWYAVHPASNNEEGGALPSQVDSALDVAYAITYYGDATESENAAPIPVRGGDRLEANIHLSPVPSLHLIVHVPEGSGHIVNLPRLQRASFDGFEPVEDAQMQSVGSGAYELSGIAAGRYTVRVPDANGQLQEPTEVNLNSGDLDVSSGRSTSKIKATVQIAGETSAPSQLRIGLRNSKGRIESVPVDMTNQASFSDVIPGKYDLVAWSQMRAYSVARFATETGTVAGHSITVPPGASLTIALALVAGSATVEGFAKREGKAAPGAMIVLVPKNPEADHDRFRRDQSDLDGSFSLANVIPGSYTVIAIENGWDLDWSESAVLAQYMKQGQSVEIPDGSSGTLHLPTAVPVQSK